jgi:sterol desaturase/sphingolipid hydroxylase (fatty acid hydroxylase superfamily)
LTEIPESYLWIIELLRGFIGPNSRLWPGYILAALLICYVIYRRYPKKTGYWAFVFPKSIYSHPSTWVDLKVMLFVRSLTGLGVFASVSVLATVASTVSNAISQTAPNDGYWPPLLMGLIILASGDFVGYWFHRINHNNAILWPFHALHHSAEVMSPITLYRQHPGYLLLATLLRSAVVGLVQGVLLGLFVGQTDFVRIAGVNAFFVLFNLAGSNLRHSHIWLSFGPLVEHFIISPAQHQIHHSLNPKHYNKNFGEVFAIWDWMFGTLYIPATYEKLEFGLSNGTSERIAQPHTTFRAAMLVPIRDSWKQIRKAIRKSAEKAEALSEGSKDP